MNESQYSKFESEIWVELHPKVNFKVWDELRLKYSSETVLEIYIELQGQINEMIDNG
jgi:hypothetical protein